MVNTASYDAFFTISQITLHNDLLHQMVTYAKKYKARFIVALQHDNRGLVLIWLLRPSPFGRNFIKFTLRYFNQ